MSYRRFLTNKDYCCIATEEHMKQLIRDVADRIPQAEQRAEMQMLEYLDQYYEIEKVLAVGKNIREYSPYVTYPGQTWIKFNEDVYKTLMAINGRKKPTKIQYWKHIIEFIDPRLIDHAPKYSQLRMYAKGDVVRFGTEYWQCIEPHGYDAEEIHLPGVSAWREAEITLWEPNMEWETDQVCLYNGQFYQYLGNLEKEEPDVAPEPLEPAEPEPTPEPDESTDSKEEENQDTDTQSDEDDGTSNESELIPDNSEDENDDEKSEEDEVLTPEEDDLWGLIGEYSEDLEYDFSEGVFDYVVAEGTVFYPVLNPNPDALVEGVNITRDDPRNANVIAHLTRIALYHLHAIIAPTNIPETRRWEYEDSMQWLYNASKFKINPQLPRKKEHGSCAPKVDWALETYQRSYDPDENPWLI